jgi:hypothetical protein
MTFKDVYSIQEALRFFVKALAWSGNIIINVSPNRLGRIPVIFEVCFPIFLPIANLGTSK